MAKAIRRFRLALLMPWRTRFPPSAETLRRDLSAAARKQEDAVTKRAAEEFYWMEVTKSSVER